MNTATRDPQKGLAAACRIALFLLFFWNAGPAFSQEIHFSGGIINRNEDGSNSWTWLLSYFEGISEHFAWSFSWLNEGHLPDHHRDGPSVQLWARKFFLNRRLSIAAGAGPYYAFDTDREGMVGDNFQNNHKLGGLFSLSATWYMQNQWLLQTRVENVWMDGNIDTTSIMFGIGYQLPPPNPPEEPATHGPNEEEYRRTANEITVFFGTTIMNGPLDNDLSAAVEYRRDLARYLSWTVGWIRETHTVEVDRQGFATQLWGRKTFFRDRLGLGVGLGIYMFKDDARHPEYGVDNDIRAAGLATLTASYRLPWQFVVRTSWSRTITDYDRDSDIFLLGLGYRF